MRLFLASLSAALLLPAATTAAPAAGRLQVVAWASVASKTGIPPADAVSGGTYCAANPIRRLFAFVRFTGMRDGVRSSVTWFFNGKRVFFFPFTWEDGDAGRTAFSLFRKKGRLEEGRYGVEVRSAGALLDGGTVRLEFGSCEPG